MKVVDYPKLFQSSDYDTAICRQVDALSAHQEVIAVYQIGGVSTPGISDIDLVVITEDDRNFHINPSEFNDSVGRYLFTHRLLGASRKIFNQAQDFTFFHNYRHLYGERPIVDSALSDDQKTLVKRQLALQFLLKMFVNVSVQKRFEIIKLRSLFLNIKALPYDFDFLGILDHPLLDLIYEGIDLRARWFDGVISEKAVIHWFSAFERDFSAFIEGLFQDYKLYTDSRAFKIAPNISVTSRKTVKVTSRGVVVRNWLQIPEAKHIKILNRLNQFEFSVPMISADEDSLMKSFLEYNRSAVEYTSKYLPNFLPLTSSLDMTKPL